MLADIWSNRPASAFGIFKFAQSLASMMGFIYPLGLDFYWQLLIAAIFNVMGTTIAVMTELSSRRYVGLDIEIHCSALNIIFSFREAKEKDEN